MPSLIKSTFWSSVQRFGSLAIGFISNLVLARLLCPEDFGVIGLIMVFVGIADVLVDGGLGNALIQKKEIDKKDISTVFTTNLLFSTFLFLLLFFLAPAIANYVNVEKFDIFLRVEAIMVLLRAFIVVPSSLINREMDFKKLATIHLLVNAISTIIAITLASCGFGVWSLILRNISLDAFTLLFLYFVKRIPLSLSIYKDSFKQLFSFGIFVAAANLVEGLYSNILSFILGKKFSVKELGYYNQAHSLEQIPVYSITSILNQVFFPFLSKQQSDLRKMTNDLIKSFRVMSFFIYPLMFFLICFAEPIITLLYSEKWLPAVPFFQILCVIGFTNFMYHLNRSVLKAIGKSKLLFLLQIAVSLLGLLLIILAIRFGIYAVVIASVSNTTLAFIIIAFFTGRQIQLSVYQQIKAVLLNFLISALVAVAVYWLFSLVNWHYIVVIALGFLTYASLYLLFQYLVGGASMKILVSIVKDKIARKNK